MIKVAKAVEAPLVASPLQGSGDQNVFLLPSVSVSDIVIDKYSAEADQISGSFVMANDNDLLIGDLGYVVSLIDAAPKLKPNTIVPEDYQTYASQDYLNIASLTSKEKKTIPFKLTIPGVPKGDYRIRIRVQTSKNVGLGWDNADVSLGRDTGFIIVPITWVAQTNDLKQKSFALDGLNVDPNGDVTLGFSYLNSGTKSLTVKPHLGIFETKTLNSKVSEQTGEQLPAVVPSKKATDGSIEIKAPEKPGSYTIFMDFVDENGKTVSSVSEYRLVVKGGSGKVISAVFNELTTKKAQIDVNIVGPADDSSVLEAATTVAILDGDKQIAEQTSEAVKLSGETGAVVPISFIFNLQSALQDPGLKVILKDAQGNVLDTYTYKVPAPKNTVGSRVPTQQNQTSPTAKPNIVGLVLGVIIALIGTIGTIVLLVRTHKRSGANTKSTIMMMLLVLGGLGILIVNLPVANAVKIIPDITPDAGAGNYYYVYRGSFQGVRVKISKPNTAEVFLPTNIPINFDLYWDKCNNRGSHAGIAIDHLKAGGKIVPTANNWVPFHDYFAHKNSEGTNGLNLGYNGTVSDSVNWTTNIGTTEYDESSGKYVSGSEYDGKYYALKSTFTGSFSVNENVGNTTFRITGYKKHLKVNQTWFLANWFGVYGWLNFSPTCENTNAVVNQDVAVTASGGDNTSYSWPSLGDDGTKVSGSGNSVVINYSTIGSKIVTVSSGGKTGSCTVTVSYPSPTVTLTSDAPASGVPSGTPVNLTWSSMYTSSCPTANNFMASGTGTSGSGIDTPTNTGASAMPKTYSITCNGLDGTSKLKDIDVMINPASTLSCSLASGQSSNVYTGSDVNFTTTGGTGYTWSVVPSSNGTVTSGQGTANATIRFTKAGVGSSVTVSGTTCPSVNVLNRIIPGDVREL